MTALASRKSREGVWIGGIMRYAPSTPSSARVIAIGSAHSPSTSSTPFALHAAAFAGSRTSARTCLPLLRRRLAAAPPTLPVMPVIRNILVALLERDADSVDGSHDCALGGGRARDAPGMKAQTNGFLLSHPSHKSKNVARMGHPFFVVGEARGRKGTAQEA